MKMDLTGILLFCFLSVPIAMQAGAAAAAISSSIEDFGQTQYLLLVIFGMVAEAIVVRIAFPCLAYQTVELAHGADATPLGVRVAMAATCLMQVAGFFGRAVCAVFVTEPRGRLLQSRDLLVLQLMACVCTEIVLGAELSIFRSRRTTPVAPSDVSATAPAQAADVECGKPVA